MLTSKVQLDYVLTRGWGASCPGRFILPPPPTQNFRESCQSPNFITPSTSEIFSWERYKLYFSQSEMLTSNVQLGYVLTRGGGQAVKGGLSCPPPRISERIDNPQILLHHLLQEYLVERDINISINLRCLLQTFSWVTYWQGVGVGGGGKLSRAVCLAPPRPEFQNGLLAPTPRTRVTKLNVGCIHLSLTEIIFISLTTKYLKIMVQ